MNRMVSATMDRKTKKRKLDYEPEEPSTSSAKRKPEADLNQYTESMKFVQKKESLFVRKTQLDWPRLTKLSKAMVQKYIKDANSENTERCLYIHNYIKDPYLSGDEDICCIYETYVVMTRLGLKMTLNSERLQLISAMAYNYIKKVSINFIAAALENNDCEVTAGFVNMVYKTHGKFIDESIVKNIDKRADKPWDRIERILRRSMLALCNLRSSDDLQKILDIELGKSKKALPSMYNSNEIAMIRVYLFFGMTERYYKMIYAVFIHFITTATEIMKTKISGNCPSKNVLMETFKSNKRDFFLHDHLDFELE